MASSPGRLRRALLLCAVSALAVNAAPVDAAPAAPQVEHVRVPSHDGVDLDGWLLRPAGVPARARLPIVLWSGPYFGQSVPAGDNPALYDNSIPDEAVPVNLLLDHGFAVAIFNVRGTGNSGGCFSWFGAAEQKDQAFLVEWLAARSWSNGNVGMMGLSYHGTTPWAAAVHDPPHLKTIVTAGIISDPYLFSHTPQGATLTNMAIGFYNSGFPAQMSLSPPVHGSPEHNTVQHAPVVPGRACEDLAAFVAEDVKGTYTDMRSREFWDERRLIDRFRNVRTAVLLVDGFQDHYGSGHQIQANEVWNLLPRAPKQMLVGQWGHSFPNHNGYNGNWLMKDWNQRLLAWLDYWLKGIGKRPATGLVSYQEGRYDAAGTPRSSKLPAPAPPWQTARAWPPPKARNEVLYLAGGKLARTPGSGSTSFRSYTDARSTADPEELLCDSGVPEAGRASVTFLSEPVSRPVAVAGNPFANLRLTSDLAGGIVAVHVFDIAPEFQCASFLTTGAGGIRYWSSGAADLRFHKGNFTGEPFPTGTPTHVRIDLTDFAERLEPDHRLAVVLSRGDPDDRMGAPYLPNITVHADGGATASHLVLPVVSGTLGGRAPTLTYPPRPFLPR